MTKDFTRLATDLLIVTKEMVAWGVDGGHTTENKLRLTVSARREEAKKLIEAGVSKRKAAKILGVSHTAIQKDLATKLPTNGNKVATRKKSMPSEDSCDFPVEEPNESDEERATRMKNAFLWRAQEAVRFGELDDLGQVEITQEILIAADHVVMTWRKLAAFFKERLNG